MTIKDIAEQAGVSISTVSRVLNDATNVSSYTQKKVLSVIDKTGFIPNQNGQSLRRVKTNKILVIIPSFSNSFYSIVIKGITNTCRSADYYPFTAVTEFSPLLEKQFLNLLTTRQFDGVISFTSCLPTAYLEKISDTFPYVQVGDYVDNPKISSISIDDEKAAYEATEYFIKKGHTKIAMLTGESLCNTRREKGFLQAKKNYGLETPPEYIINANYQYDSGLEYDSGIDSCEKLLNLPDPPTAILAAFDTIAVGVVKCALSRGLVLGEDLLVIGFDNTPISKSFVPSISTISHPRYEMGCLAVNILLDQIDSGKLNSKRIILPHDLIIRESS